MDRKPLMHEIGADRDSSMLAYDECRQLKNSDPLILPAGMTSGMFPEFVPARGLSGGNRQTMWAFLFPGRESLPGTVQRRLRLNDGDLIILHDDCPPSWQRSDHVVILLHGLCGSHQSGYMVRMARRLTAMGIRTLRMDHRGCGAGVHLARNPYHAGRVEDLAAAVEMVERLCPGSPISIAGYSLSGNLLLKYLGGNPADLPLSLFRAVAVCPPIDLLECAASLGATQAGRRYDWYFSKRLIQQISRSSQWRDDLPLASAERAPRRIYEFDELYTAPASGFDSVDHYYSCASSRSVIGDIRVHTTILAAEDDPVVSSRVFRRLEVPANVSLHLTRHGGHLGFVGRKGVDSDRRWMDWRVIDWLLN